MQLCEGYELDKEILVNHTEKGKQVMILDLGAPVSLAGKEWMDQYLKDHELEVGDMKTSEYFQYILFPSILLSITGCSTIFLLSYCLLGPHINI